MKSSFIAATLVATAVSAHAPTRRHHMRRSSFSRRDDGAISGYAYYGYQNGIAGACGGAPHDDSELLAGLETSQWGPMDQVSSKCGKQISVTNVATGANVLATVTDSCSGCSFGGPGSLYLSVAAFKALGDLDIGVLNVTWSYTDNVSSVAAPAQQAPSSTETIGQANAFNALSPPSQGDQQRAASSGNGISASAPAPASSTDAPTKNSDANGGTQVQSQVQSPAPASQSASVKSTSGGSVGTNGGVSADGWRQATSWSGQAIFDNFDQEDKPCDNGGNCYFSGTGNTWVEGNQAVIGVENTQNVGFGQRKTVRLASKNSYNIGTGKLFIFDLASMPADCGHWPALWMVSRTGPWPRNGEIDIIESVNLYNVNVQSVHTGSGCGTSGQGMTSSINPGDNMYSCDANVNAVACGATGKRHGAVGPSFNAGGGGIHILRWEWSGIYMYFFPRNSIPSDIQAGSPQPSSWGTPDYFISADGCSPGEEHFKDLSIMISNNPGGVMSSGTWYIAGAGDAGVSCADSSGQLDPVNFVLNQGNRMGAQSFKFNSISVYEKQ